MQFASLTNLKSAHIGLFWQRVRSEYPNVSEQAVIPPVFETFGIPSPQAPLIQIETFLSPPLPRYWFEFPNSPDLLQIQHDRILHNWRQQADNSRVYPRYETVKISFEKDLEAFRQWLSDEQIGELRQINVRSPISTSFLCPRSARTTVTWKVLRLFRPENSAKIPRTNLREPIFRPRSYFHSTISLRAACMRISSRHSFKVTEARLSDWRSLHVAVPGGKPLQMLSHSLMLKETRSFEPSRP